MGRHLVLTVHGIGEQKPGETVDAVVGAATTRFPDVERVPVTVERDLIELAEAEFSGVSRNAALFPVHLRRVKPVKGTDETLFAEVYWADRSPAPQGPFWTIFDLLKVVLGLGYLAMDNVENNRGWIATGIVHLFTWLFYGLVAPLNAMLAIGALVLLIDATPFDIVASETPSDARTWLQIPLIWLFFLHGLLTLGVGAFTLARLSKTYLIRIFGRGMCLLGLAILFSAEYGAFGGDFRGNSCATASCPTGGRDSFPNLEAFVDYCIMALGMAWAGVLGLAVLSYLSVFFQRKQIPPAGETGHRVIYPSVCTAMIVFWMVLSGAIWMGFVELVQRVNGTKNGTVPSLLEAYFADQMEEALGSLAMTFVGLGLLVLVGVALLVVRRMNKELLYKQNELGSRVILNVGLQWALFVVLMMIALFIAHDAYREIYGAVVGGHHVTAKSYPMFDDMADWLNSITPYVMTALLGLFVLIYNFSNFVAAGLGVVRDIVTYAVMQGCMWRAGADVRRGNFPERNAIDARFRRVLYYGAEVFQPDRITVISHSQGTVIATQMLQNKWIRKKIDKLKEGDPNGAAPEVLLITMGSPVTHIYRRYFGEFFGVSLSDMPEGTAWHNIHRTDDFVGTTIEGVDGLAGNWPVPAGGHTGYFTDFYVWRRLWQDVGFRLF